MKTEELTGVALDWAVAKAIGQPIVIEPPHYGTGWRLFKFAPAPRAMSERWSPSTLPAQIVPLMMEYRIGAEPNYEGNWWCADVCDIDGEVLGLGQGADPMIAACVALVQCKLGDTIELPDELQ